MALSVQIPGGGALELDYLLLDQNGTLSDRGELIPGVADRIRRLSGKLSIQVLSGDSFGALEKILSQLAVDGHKVESGAEKRAVADRLGGHRCAAIGNGRNDVEMLKACALSIAVMGPEGTSTQAAMAAQVLCGSILDAFDLLLDTRAVAATLKA